MPVAGLQSIHSTQRYTHTHAPVSPTAQVQCQVMTELKEGSEEWRHSEWREGPELLETFGKGQEMLQESRK